MVRKFPEVPFSCSGISLGLGEPLRSGGQTVERMEFCIRNCDPTMAPGGGLPSGVMTGRQVTQLICHKDGRRFVTSVPLLRLPCRGSIP